METKKKLLRGNIFLKKILEFWNSEVVSYIVCKQKSNFRHVTFFSSNFQPPFLSNAYFAYSRSYTKPKYITH